MRCGSPRSGGARSLKFRGCCHPLFLSRHSSITWARNTPHRSHGLASGCYSPSRRESLVLPNSTDVLDCSTTQLSRTVPLQIPYIRFEQLLISLYAIEPGGVRQPEERPRLVASFLRLPNRLRRASSPGRGKHRAEPESSPIPGDLSALG